MQTPPDGRPRAALHHRSPQERHAKRQGKSDQRQGKSVQQQAGAGQELLLPARDWLHPDPECVSSASLGPSLRRVCPPQATGATSPFALLEHAIARDLHSSLLNLNTILCIVTFSPPSHPLRGRHG